MVKNGARVLFNLTNFAWSKTKYAQQQHYQVSKFRAIENRVFMARTTNSGLTAIINRRGQIVKKIGMFKKDYLYGEVKIAKNQTLTLYTKIGNLIVGFFLILLLFLIFKKN